MRTVSMRVAAACCAALVLAGCVSTPGGVTSSTIPITEKSSYTVIQKDVESNDWNLAVLFIPLWPLSAYSALQNTKRDHGADGMINVHANNTSLSLILISYNELEIRGDAIKINQNSVQ